MRGVSRLDFALSNQAGSMMAEDVVLRWDLATDGNLDHVPVDIVLKDEITYYSVDRPMPVETLMLKTSLAPKIPKGINSFRW